MIGIKCYVTPLISSHIVAFAVDSEERSNIYTKIIEINVWKV